MHPETKGKDEIIAVSSASVRSPSERTKQMRRLASARPANVRAINKCSEDEAAPSADVAACWAAVRAGKPAEFSQDFWESEDLALRFPEGRLQSKATLERVRLPGRHLIRRKTLPKPLSHCDLLCWTWHCHGVPGLSHTRDTKAQEALKQFVPNCSAPIFDVGTPGFLPGFLSLGFGHWGGFSHGARRAGTFCASS